MYSRCGSGEDLYVLRDTFSIELSRGKRSLCSMCYKCKDDTQCICQDPTVCLNCRHDLISDPDCERCKTLRGEEEEEDDAVMQAWYEDEDEDEEEEEDEDAAALKDEDLQPKVRYARPTLRPIEVPDAFAPRQRRCGGCARTVYLGEFTTVLPDGQFFHELCYPTHV